MPPLTLATDGAQHIPAALDNDAISKLLATLKPIDTGKPGIRITRYPALRPMLEASGIIGRHAAAHLGATTHPVRCLLFDKSAHNNWSLAWHQDRTIAVQSRIDTPGFGPWTVKDGIPHVAPPQALLDCMVTLRIHFDPVSMDNAPLLIAPSSHRQGRVPETDIPDLVTQCGTHACLAAAGDIWAYATPILHASEAASYPTRRRVLQIDYSADTLPNGLSWMGI
ncbi:phytanoyl-CoA dioxygenase family protein [Sphingobium aquiterrae]|uniref:phytanoyl-CoA dioxygenase family protein n=1 Tax=Sphingobium aquiterrae TaxID=2038656 RepID=UPI00301AE566